MRDGRQQIRRRNVTALLFGWLVLLTIGLVACSKWGADDRLPSMPTSRRALGAAVHGDLFYVAGGWNGESTQLDTVEAYDPVHRSWQVMAPLRSPRSQHHLISAVGALWVVGGWSADTGLISAVERFDAAVGNWEVVTHLPTPRREPGVALWHERIVVAGGFDGRSDADLDGYSAQVEVYDPRRDTWERLPALNQPRRGLNLVVVDGDLYAVGGYSTGSPGFLSTVERYNAEQARWEQLSWPITPRTWASVVAVEDDLLIAGGFNQSGFLDLVERVHPQTGTVCRPPRLASARAWFGAALVEDGLLVVGGETADGFSDALLLADVNCTQSP